MEALLALLVIYLVVALLIFPIWALIRIGGLSDSERELRRQLGYLDDEMKNLRAKVREGAVTAAPAMPATTASPAPAAPPAQPVAVTPPVVVAPPVIVVPPPPALAPVVVRPAVVTPPPVVRAPVAPEPLPEDAPPLLAPATAAEKAELHRRAEEALQRIGTPLPRPVYVPPPPPPPGWLDKINWEQFMGAKLFAWLGGLALLLGVAFFLKYSIDHGWIPNEVRVAMGFVFGAGLIVGGLWIPRDKYAITAQTLIGAGVVSLYAVTFVCGKDHFNFLGPVAMLLVMSLITATAFILAVRLDAQPVAVLGILGGFLTPKLVSTGVDNPPGLFGYIALLDLGLIAVALHRRWFYLVALGAGGTVLTMIGWAGIFFAPEKTTTAMTVCLGFTVLFMAAQEASRRWERGSPMLLNSAIVFPAVAFGFGWMFLDYPEAAGGTAVFFGYVFLASLACFVLAWRESLGALVAVAAGATVLLLVRWTGMTFTTAQAPVVVTVCLAFCGVYLGAYLLALWQDRATAPVLWSAVALPFVALGFALFLMDNAAVGARPGLLFGFILAADAVLLTLAWLDDRLTRVHLVAGLSVFALLSIWTGRHLTDELLSWALAAYLLFAALHTVFPVLLQRHRPAATPTWWSQLFPPLTLLLLLFPIIKLDTVSFLIWPAILFIDLLAIGLAVLSASLLAVAAVLVLTLVATGVCIFKVPVALVFAPSLLLVIGFFAVFFFAASLWLVRKLGARLPAGDRQLAGVFGDARAQIPAFASLLPFLLLIMVCARLNVPDPSAVFGLGLLLVVLTLGLARLLVIEWLPACALVGVAALQYAWHARHFQPGDATVPFGWHLGFYLVFTVYPFLFRREFAKLTGPWAVAALSGVAHFWVVYTTVRGVALQDFLGVVPALFALAPLGSLFLIRKEVPAENPKRLNQLAWFGGVALFFITLIFPIQFDRQWLTVAWALEGAALLWLSHRVPHRGLQAVGAVLLVTAFARLALNPAVLGYHVRGDTAVFNWYLYAYGLATAALFAGARLAAPPRDGVLGFRVPPLFNTLGTILAFLLLNLEVADYFTAPGARALAFQFTGNFGRDMTYTIAWALFALGLLGAGLWQRQKAARYAAIALLSVALLKLFFHDLARLEALYRIGALFAVAVIAILASFAYQRFLPSNEKTPPPLP